MKPTLQTEKNKTRLEVVSSPETKEKEPELKGTFWSVLLLGACLVVSWLGVYLLYLQRM